MKLTVVGCSGSVPGPDSTCSCYLVEADGFRLLLDVGTGSAGPLQRYAPPEAIDAAFITHAHADHYYDLSTISYLRMRADIKEPFRVYGPPRVVEIVAEDPDFAAGPVPETIGPWRARCAPVQHIRDSWAIRLDDTLCYTGDTAACPALDELAAGCSVILAEASEFDAGPASGGHLSAGAAGRLAAASDARLLILTHLRAWQDHGALLQEAAGYATCPVVLAHPGLTLAL